MKRFLPLLLLSLSIILGACNAPDSSQLAPSPVNGIHQAAEDPIPTAAPAGPGPAQAATNSPNNIPTQVADAPLPDAETVRQLMRRAHLHWHTLWGDSLGFSYAGDGSTAPISGGRIQVWAQQPTQALALLGAAEGGPGELWVSDGTYYRYTAMGEDRQPFPEYVTAPQPPPADAPPDYLPQPPGLLLGFPMSDMIFPIGIAERSGDYQVEGRENIAGREVYILAWSPPGGPVLTRFWVDTITGVILRQQGFSKADARQLTTDSYFTRIIFDIVLPEGIFNLDRTIPDSFPNDYTQVTP